MFNNYKITDQSNRAKTEIQESVYTKRENMCLTSSQKDVNFEYRDRVGLIEEHGSILDPPKT